MKALKALELLGDLSSSQWGMFTAAQAHASGVSRLELSRLANSEHLERLAHGVYRHTGAPTDEFEYLRAAWLGADPKRLASDRMDDGQRGVVVSGQAAAWLHGVGTLRVERYEFSSSTRRQTQRSELTYRARKDLTPAVITIKHGLPVTTLEQTIADLVRSRTDLSLVAEVLGEAHRGYGLDADILVQLLAPLAARSGFARGDGASLLDRLMTLAGIDADSVTTRVAQDPLVGPLIAAKVLAAQLNDSVAMSADLQEAMRALGSHPIGSGSQVQESMSGAGVRLADEMQDLITRSMMGTSGKLVSEAHRNAMAEIVKGFPQFDADSAKLVKLVGAQVISANPELQEAITRVGSFEVGMNELQESLVKVASSPQLRGGGRQRSALTEATRSLERFTERAKAAEMISKGSTPFAVQEPNTRSTADTEASDG